MQARQNDNTPATATTSSRPSRRPPDRPAQGKLHWLLMTQQYDDDDDDMVSRQRICLWGETEIIQIHIPDSSLAAWLSSDTDLNVPLTRKDSKETAAQAAESRQQQQQQQLNTVA